MTIKSAKTVIVGETQVGKTWLAMRAFLQNFDPSAVPQPTIGAEFFEGIYPIDEYGNSMKFEVWDTAGQEAYKPIAPVFFRNSVIAILVFDVTVKKTLESLDYYVKILNESEPDCFIAVVGNKIDLQEKRVISHAEGQNFAESIGSDFYMETSALTGEGVRELFCSLARQDVKISGLKPIKFEELHEKKEEEENNGNKCC